MGENTERTDDSYDGKEAAEGVNKTHFLLLKCFQEIDDHAFLELYRESSGENAPEWYPDLTVSEAMKKYEESYLDYIHGQFEQEHGMLALLADDTGYRSGLRILPTKKEHCYYIEALETRPDSRKKGYAAWLLKRTVKALGEQDIFFSSVQKTNAASIAAHFAAGFIREKEYFIEDGKRDDAMATMTYYNKRDDNLRVPSAEDLKKDTRN